MMKLRAEPARIWSAVTCHRFCRFGDLSPKRGRVQRPGRVGRLSALDGDKSPAESADKSAHSKVVAAPPRWVHLCPSVVSILFVHFNCRSQVHFALPWAIIFRAFGPFGLSLVTSASTVRFALWPRRL